MGIKTELGCLGKKHKYKNCIQSCVHAFGQKDLFWKPLSMGILSKFGTEVHRNSENPKYRITDGNGRVDKK